jgi:hypothetical protein
MTTVKIHEGNIITVLTVGSLSLLLVLIVSGLIFATPRFAASTLAGGLLAIANFYWLRSVLVRSLRLQVQEAPRFALFRFLARLFVMAVTVYLLLVICKADVFGLLLGLSVLVFNIMSLSFYMISAKGD